jgi:hypothetical protein
MDRSMVLEFVRGGRIAVKRPDKGGIPDSFDRYASIEVDIRGPYSRTLQGDGIDEKKEWNVVAPVLTDDDPHVPGGITACPEIRS